MNFMFVFEEFFHLYIGYTIYQMISGCNQRETKLKYRLLILLVEILSYSSVLILSFN